MKERDKAGRGIAWGDIAGRDGSKLGIAGPDSGGHDNLSRKIKKRDKVGRDFAGRDSIGHDNFKHDIIGRDRPRRNNAGCPLTWCSVVSLLFLLLLPLLVFPTFGSSAERATQASDGDAILRRIDDNMGSDNKITTSEMIIHGRRASRSITSKSWVRGRTESFTEYLAPPRERGTKMLKLGDQLWTYTPSSDRTILVAGHMLRQSVMGSDLSYEDMMEDPRLAVLYDAVIAAEEEYEGRPCWVLDLTSKGEEIAYHARKIWVDKERFVALKENRYAKSGKLLKTTEVKSVERQGGRWVPTRIVFKDVLKEGEGTEFILQSIEFNAEIADTVFNKASLKR